MQLEKNRIAALDNIRGILSLLGIPFHASFFLYVDSAVLSGHLLTKPNHFLLEPVSRTVAHTFLAWFYFYTFWMPVFFLLAGFFAHHITEKKGVSHFLKNRFFRVGLPLAFYFLWLVPCYLMRILFITLYQKTSYLTTIQIYAPGQPH